MDGNPARKISIVVPVYNEEESLPALHREVTAAMGAMNCEAYELILVDDGSTDKSVQIARDIQQDDPDHVTVLVLRRNFGQTAALAAGFDAAAGDIVVPMDADLQNDPADIERLVEKLDEGYDVVSGWRADRQDKFLSRRLPSNLANGLISRVTGVALHDYGCTLKAYNRDIVDNLRLYGEMHRFLPALASWSGARVAEIVVNHRPRKFGASKYGIGRTQRVLLDLLTIKFLLKYSTKPMQVFGKWGLLTLSLAFLFAAIALILKFTFANEDLTGNPWMYLAIFFGLGGIQLISVGLLGEISVRTYYESQQKPIYAIRERIAREHVAKK
jgi:glycosyltransferase involved in cell wall biosynthesis